MARAKTVTAERKLAVVPWAVKGGCRPERFLCFRSGWPLGVCILRTGGAGEPVSPTRL